MMDMFLISRIIEIQTLRTRALRKPTEMEIIAARIERARQRARLSRRVMLWLRWQVRRRTHRRRMAPDHVIASARGRRPRQPSCLAERVTVRPQGGRETALPCRLY